MPYYTRSQARARFHEPGTPDHRLAVIRPSTPESRPATPFERMPPSPHPSRSPQDSRPPTPYALHALQPIPLPLPYSHLDLPFPLNIEEMCAFIYERLDEFYRVSGSLPKLRCCLRMFAFIDLHPEIHEHPSFHGIIRKKVTELRADMDIMKRDSISIFKHIYGPNLKDHDMVNLLVEARDTLLCCDELEVVFRSIERAF